MKRILTSILTLFFLFFSYSKNNACTNYLITKGASADGSTMISYAADSHVLYGELYFFPATNYPAGTLIDIYEWDTGKFLGQIAQVARTYSVTGNMNEFQVAIGETTFGGRSEVNGQEGIMDYGSLIYITLQRAKTAREAIRIMGELVQEYGYYSTGESFSISDPDEVWIMEMVGKAKGDKGAVWVAGLVPDGYVCGHANQARITTFSMKDTKNWMCAPDVISYARDKGLYVGEDKDFSFSDTYAPVDFGAARFSEIRVWSMFKDINTDMQKHFDYVKGNVLHDEAFADGRKNPNKYCTNRMPLWIKPNRKITLEDMFEFMRDHLEGTPLDMSKDIGAGDFGLPYRWRPLTWEVDGQTYCNERATATQQTGFSFIAQARGFMPQTIGGILWFGVDDASSTVYTPIYSGSYRVPETFKEGNGSMMEFSETSAFWTFSQVTNFAYTRYNIIHPEVDSLQKLIEKENINMVKVIDEKAKALYKQDEKLAREFVTDYSVQTADNLTFRWKKFYQYLFMKYMDGNVKTVNPQQRNPNLKQPGYSKETYERIVKETGEKFKMPKSNH